MLTRQSSTASLPSAAGSASREQPLPRKMLTRQSSTASLPSDSESDSETLTRTRTAIPLPSSAAASASRGQALPRKMLTRQSSTASLPSDSESDSERGSASREQQQQQEQQQEQEEEQQQEQEEEQQQEQEEKEVSREQSPPARRPWSCCLCGDDASSDSESELDPLTSCSKDSNRERALFKTVPPYEVIPMATRSTSARTLCDDDKVSTNENQLEESRAHILVLTQAELTVRSLQAAAVRAREKVEILELGSNWAPQSEPGPEGPPFPQFGLSLTALQAFRDEFPEISEDATTSDVCHTIIKAMTVPQGWTHISTVEDLGRKWYSHRYERRWPVTGAAGSAQQPSQDHAPPGTCSYVDILRADPATAIWCAPATAFLSHAWLYKFLNVVAALEAFEAAQPEGSPPIFWWFDCFCIDEHATQTLPREWWSTTFQSAIKSIGRTVMMLSPWEQPVTLTRAWCLWELYSTVSVGASFCVCLGATEQASFEALFGKGGSGWRKIFATFASIDVSKAEAGDPQDLNMILGAAEAVEGGLSGLNDTAVAQLREWFLGELRRLARLRATARLAHESAARETFEIATALSELGALDQALELFQLVGAYFASTDGETGANGVAVGTNIADTLMQQGKYVDARKVLHTSVVSTTARYGAEHGRTLAAHLQLGYCLMEQEEFKLAREEIQLAADGFDALHNQSLHGDTVRALHSLATLNMREGNISDAIAGFEQTTARWTELLGATSSETLRSQANLANGMLEVGRVDEALALLEIAAPALTAQLGAKSQPAAQAQRWLELANHAQTIQVKRTG